MKEVFIKNLKELETWLRKNYKQKESVWVVHYKFASGKSDMTRSNLVDTLLRFGWIDSLPGKVDEERTKIKISPRNPKSVWSLINVEKIKRLVDEGQMHKNGLEVVRQAIENGKFLRPYTTKGGKQIFSEIKYKL